MNITSNSGQIRKHKKRRKTKKTSFPKEKVENTDLYKPVLDKVMTTQEQCVKQNFIAPLTSKNNSTCSKASESILMRLYDQL